MLTKEELQPGKRYMALSPKGDEIIGTCDIVPACAHARAFTFENGQLEPEFIGETECYWDGQYTEERNGYKLYQCSEGMSWTEGELRFRELTAEDEDSQEAELIEIGET